MLVGIIGSEFSDKDRFIKLLKNDNGFEELKRNVGEKLQELKRDVEEKSDELKRDIEEKLDELKRDVGEKSDELKRDMEKKLDELKHDVGEKSDEFKRDGEKSDELNHDVGKKSDKLNHDVGKKSDKLIKMIKKNWKTKFVIEVKTEEELYVYKKCSLFLLLAVDDALSTRYDVWVDQNKKNDKPPQLLQNVDVSAFLQKVDDDKKEKL
ncbi:22120_t:CDS:2 [Gigaspora rosea]|nr:22120_t:CDS:2 [Gigaspora rosea]